MDNIENSNILMKLFFSFTKRSPDCDSLGLNHLAEGWGEAKPSGFRIGITQSPHDGRWPIFWKTVEDCPRYRKKVSSIFMDV